jgi:hypothetical protein
MNTSPIAETYRQRGKLCFRLADGTADLWIKDGLQRYGAEMLQIAKELEITTEPTSGPYVAA